MQDFLDIQYTKVIKYLQYTLTLPESLLPEQDFILGVQKVGFVVKIVWVQT